MPDARALEAVRNFGTALLIGALVGIEREKRKEQEAEPSIGGLRTFILMSLLGAIGGMARRRAPCPPCSWRKSWPRGSLGGRGVDPEPDG